MVSLVLGLLTAAASACAAPANSQQEAVCVVDRIVDGDTIYCGDGRKVRLTGIDSPERDQRPFGAASRQALAAMLPSGTPVRLEADVAPRDQYGRVLAYAWNGHTLINERMVQDGWAVLYTVPPNVKYADRLSRAQKEARARGAGLWASHGFDCQPKEFRRGRCVS
jgi:micrococcal nuclease